MAEITCGHCGYSDNDRHFAIVIDEKTMAKLRYQTTTFRDPALLPRYRCLNCTCRWRVIVRQGRTVVEITGFGPLGQRATFNPEQDLMTKGPWPRSLFREGLAA